MDRAAFAQGPATEATVDRNLALELVRTTEYAALASARWIGRGEKEAADQAAVDAMRLMLDTVRMDGVVVIGEGEKDEAPMLYNGERIGDGSPPEVDIAVDPLEGTELTAKGFPGALATIAVSERGTMFNPGPIVYMEKMVCAPSLAHVLEGGFERPLHDTLRQIAYAKGTEIIRQGEAGDAFYLVVDGAVEVIRDGVHVDDMGAGASFGEVALISGEPRNATVRATQDCRAYRLDSAAFLSAVTGNPYSRAAAGRVALERGWSAGR